MKPKIVFFSRSYQAKLFPLLKSELYESVHVVLTNNEKIALERQGLDIKYCFENYNNKTEIIDDSYLRTSFLSDRFLNNKNHDYRIDFLKKEIAFWSDIFDDYRPIAVINEQVAIEIAEVMYIEAKRRNIQYKAWMTNPVNGLFYWTSNPLSLSLNDDVFLTEPSQGSIDIAKEYIKDVLEKNERPYYLNPFLNIKKIDLLISSIKGIVKSIVKEKLIKKNRSFYENSLPASYNFFNRNLNSLIYKYDDEKSFSKYDIILYPLHYEPEASLSYLSEFFSNQVALIENIAKCLNHNQVLVVKEHPAQQGMLLTKKYRDLLKGVSSLYYLPSTVLSFDIIKKSKLIITLTSHLGWEALILGKPVYLLGEMFYDKYPFVNKLESWEKLRDSIRNSTYLYPTEESIIKYIAQLLEISYEGYPFPGGDLYSDNNIKKIISSIEKELFLTSI